MARAPRSNDDIGARVRVHRERSGKSQAVIAGLAGISEDYLGQIERGRKTPSAGVIQALAAALRVPAGILLGDSATDTAAPVLRGGDRLALALMSGGGEPVDVAALVSRTESAWNTWQHSGHRYTEVLPILPQLIRDTEATLRRDRHGADRRRVAAVASELYWLLRTVTRRVGRSDLSYLVADRGVRAAEDADDPIGLAVARWNLGHVLLISNEYDAAIELATDAAATVLADVGATTAAVAMTGALELVAAMAEARAGRLWEARDRLHKVHPTANRLRGAGNVGHTMFGALNVGLYAIAVELQAGDAIEALRITETLDMTECPSVERRFTCALDLARAYELRRQETGVLLHLLDAEQSAPEDLQYNPAAHDMIRRLVQGTRSPTRSQAARLADRLGIPV
ncbi:helix-turn-helix domain-containing protein [Nocardia sp. CDC160]|uniref:helix-turn-helix domain-containing protein n=1 Tax=Nocardia sp. CDC160 TaxID=3112166 RepID=UPI002DB89E2D|nr:helix-turn-helix domain-containing protein [Nocardia sp. CDC160]MEC3919947.1 helix-turn-helix domain-containing protein [Nocardia sp. CDC160]